jgi:hypothetical protein
MFKSPKFYLNKYFSLFFVLVFNYSYQAKAQYCVGSNLGGGACNTGQLINSVVIPGTSLSNSIPTCTNGVNGALTVFPASGNTTASLIQGQTYSINVTTDANNIISLWIDYNHNLIFENTEWTQVCLTSASGIANTASFTVPFGIYTGQTGMRVRSRQSTVSNGANDACSAFGSGETEDYTVTILQGTPCTAPPVAGTTQATVASACLGINFTLSLTGNSLGSGISYQWQLSQNNTTWTNMNGQTSSVCNTSLTVPMYYRCVVVCNAVSDVSSPVFVGLNSPLQCYCPSTATSTADDDIGNVTFGGLNNGIPGSALNNPSSIELYSDFTALTPQLYFPGNTYSISVTQINRTGFYTCYLGTYIDYNQDGDFFDLGEEVFTATSANGAGGNVMTGNVTIPMSAVSGITRMRFVLSEAAVSPCGTYVYGETEDYLISIQPATPCVAPPSAGILTTAQNSVCPSTMFGFQIQGNTIGSGLTHQWQNSSNGINWTNILGATTSNFTTSQNQSTYYRYVITCNSISDTSNSVFVGMNALNTCYCNSTASNVVDDDIGNVTFGTLNNGIGTPAQNNSTSLNLYTDFTSLPPQPFIQTYSYPLSITQINSAGFYACWIAVFIDYNQDGDFTDTGERVFDAQTAAAIGGNLVTGNVVVPISASPGNTRMRVVLVESGTNAITSCAMYTWGETEDYTITIVPIAPCIAPPTAGLTFASSGAVCPHESFDLSLIGSSIGLGLSYQWQSSANGFTWFDIVGAVSQNYSASQLTSTYYRCALTCSGVTDYSNGLFVPMQSGSATFTTITGGIIPDNNTSVCFPILVSGLPSISDTLFGLTEVCINIQHPEVGELKVFLISPAGDTVYLSDNNGGLFANYTNTCFAMNGANGYIYAANAPFTGTFIPNYSINAFNEGQNPNGTWFLCIKDEAPSVSLPGNFLNASISFCNNPPKDPPIPVGSCSGSNAFACQCPDGSQNCDLLPDMTASALIIQNDHPESLGSMRLSNATPNIGWGPMEIHGSGQCFCDTVSVSCVTTVCPNGDPVREIVKQTIYHKNQGLMTNYTRDAGYMSYHPTHGHVHVDSWGEFSLRMPTSNPDATTWPIVGTGAKVSFCLINLGNCTNNFGYCVNNSGTVISQADIPNSGFGIVTGCGRDQGIFTGSLDIYSSGLAGMQIDFPGACNGNYAIVSITDPNNDFLEQDETNNWVQVPVTLTQQFPPSGQTSFAYTAAGNTLSFTNTTPLSTGYLWDFGDGTSDTTSNPIHTFSGNGPYTVKLIALNQCYTASTQIILITGLAKNENFALGFSANPNPSNGNVQISYFLPQRELVTIELYNLLGERLSTISREMQDAGKHLLDYNFQNVGIEGGTYLIKIKVAQKEQTLRLVILN